jgi:polyferredoxin
MTTQQIKILPTVIGITVGISLYASIGWWGFIILFPWIGIAISIGIHFQQTLERKKKIIGRKITILSILPALLLFVPLVNKENLQLEGVVLIVLVGYFSKGFIHYAVAKVFGPLIWGRGFCGWACWTAAILDWLPITKPKTITVSNKIKRLRYLTLSISLLGPIVAIFVFHYDVRISYVGKAELKWMITSNIIYYLLAIPLAFYFTDNRAFCKILCPVSLVMKIPAQFARNKKRPSENECIECGSCNNNCPMDVDVMSFISGQSSVTDTECISCGNCSLVCPVNAIK